MIFKPRRGQKSVFLGIITVLAITGSAPIYSAFSQTTVIPDCPSVDEFPEKGTFDGECGPEEKKDKQQTTDDMKKDKKKS